MLGQRAAVLASRRMRAEAFMVSLVGPVSWAGAPTPRAAELEVAALH